MALTISLVGKQMLYSSIITKLILLGLSWRCHLDVIFFRKPIRNHRLLYDGKYLDTFLCWLLNTFLCWLLNTSEKFIIAGLSLSVAFETSSGTVSMTSALWF